MPKCLKLSVWSGPRNVSTALMDSFRQRPDTLVVDEPLYSHYLRVTGADHPGDEEVMASMDCDSECVIKEIILGPCERPIHFFKNMAHHLAGLDRGFLRRITNVLLVRDPKEMLPSLVKQLPCPTLRDTGLKEQVEILGIILEQGVDPVVLDVKELLLEPAGVLQRACEMLGIPFVEAMLSWPPGPKPEDGVWAKHWYRSVHASTTFESYQPKTERFPERLEPLLEQCVPLYEKLRQHAITARA
jgi:hypothetical protein